MRVRLTLTLPRQAGSVAVARRVVGQILAALGVRTDCRQEIELAVSEACSNAVRHAHSGPAYEITAHLDNSDCVITINDNSSSAAPTETAMPPASALAGRGLAIMRATMDGIELRPRPLGGLSVRMLKTLTWNAGALGGPPL
jgi:serine/threonine-protein kinase RsbW